MIGVLLPSCPFPTITDGVTIVAVITGMSLRVFWWGGVIETFLVPSGWNSFSSVPWIGVIVFLWSLGKFVTSTPKVTLKVFQIMNKTNDMARRGIFRSLFERTTAAPGRACLRIFTSRLSSFIGILSGRLKPWSSSQSRKESNVVFLLILRKEELILVFLQLVVFAREE